MSSMVVVAYLKSLLLSQESARRSPIYTDEKFSKVTSLVNIDSNSQKSACYYRVAKTHRMA